MLGVWPSVQSNFGVFVPAALKIANFKYVPMLNLIRPLRKLVLIINELVYHFVFHSVQGLRLIIIALY